MRTERREFDREAKEKGHLARRGGSDRVKENPFPVGSRCFESFIAGWDEADRAIAAGMEQPYTGPDSE